jgi:hypothetical protein
MKRYLIQPARISLITVFAFLFTQLLGCASKTVDPENYSGFLSDYSKLQLVETESGAEVLRWISEDVTPENYKVLIEKTIHYPQPEPTELVSQEMLTQLTSLIDIKLDAAVRKSYQVVTEPGVGVMRIKPAITGVAESMEGISTLEVLPVGLVIGVTKAALGTRDRDVAIYFELQAEDSLSGEVLGGAVRKGQGEQLENDKTQLTIEHLDDMITVWGKDASAVFGRSE